MNIPINQIRNDNIQPTINPPNFYKDTISKSIPIDNLIIGGGLNGVLTAYLLAKSGEKVTLIERNKVANGHTSANTAYITQFADNNLQSYVNRYGEEYAKLIWDSGLKAISIIEKIINREDIECEYTKKPAYVFALDYNDLERLRDEYWTSKKLGFTNIKFRTINKIGFGDLGYLELEDQARFNPQMFTKRLAEICKNIGVNILENTELLDIEESEDGNTIVTTNNISFAAKKIINTTYTALTAPEQIQNKLNNVKNFILEARIKKDTLPEAIFYSSSEPFYYFRVDSNGEEFDHIMFCSKIYGKNMDEDDYFRTLENYMREILNNVEYEIMYKWTQNITESDDGLPFVGYLPQYSNELISTGFGNAITTYSIISALINRDLILNVENRWEDLFSPARSIGPFSSITRKLNTRLNKLTSIFNTKANSKLKEYDISLEDNFIGK